MKLNQRQVDIIEDLYVDNHALAMGSDDDRRKLTKMIAEQLCFEFGNSWGTKASSPTNPQSKDAIAYTDKTKLYAWDWQSGTSRAPQVTVNQEGEDITGQWFISVDPVDHLGVGHPVPPPDPTPTSPLEDRVKDLEAKISTLEVAINGLVGDSVDIEDRVKVLEDNKVTIPANVAKKGDKVTVSGKILGFGVTAKGTIDQ